MNVAEQICEKARELPEPLAREVLMFIERISGRWEVSSEELENAQEEVMKRIWKNKEDDIWNEL